jgi:hypothetical protein
MEKVPEGVEPRLDLSRGDIDFQSVMQEGIGNVVMIVPLIPVAVLSERHRTRGAEQCSHEKDDEDLSLADRREYVPV